MLTIISVDSKSFQHSTDLGHSCRKPNAVQETPVAQKVTSRLETKTPASPLQ
jgi:hypothetical protein